MASECYEKIAFALYDCKWYTLPVDLQKYFVITIINAQKPLNYCGYGIMILDLKTFHNVSAIEWFGDDGISENMTKLWL